MEAVFVITHTIMVACILAIVCISISEIDQIRRKRRALSFLVAAMEKARSFRFSTISFYRVATSLLAFFIR
jgi:hypothetical protein